MGKLLQSVWEELRQEIVADELFAATRYYESVDDRPSADVMTKIVERATEPRTFLDATWELGGPPEYRYAMLRILHEAMRRTEGTKATVEKDTIVIGPDEMGAVMKHTETGALTLAGEGSCFLVIGDLRVNGPLVGNLHSYTSVLVSGKLEARSIFTSGEIVAVGGIVSDTFAYFEGNDHSSVSPSVTTRILMQNESFDRLGVVTSEVAIAEHFYSMDEARWEELCRSLGIELPHGGVAALETYLLSHGAPPV